MGVGGAGGRDVDGWGGADWMGRPAPPPVPHSGFVLIAQVGPRGEVLPKFKIVGPFPLSLFSPVSSLYFLQSGGLISDLDFGLLTIFILAFASHFFLFLVDSPYKKAIGVSGTKHMSAFIDHFSTGDGRRLTEAIREICQIIE